VILPGWLEIVPCHWLTLGPVTGDFACFLG
jgi:hypothetical protein